VKKLIQLLFSVILLSASNSAFADEKKIDVNLDNIRTVESHIQIDRYQKIAGGVNKWVHLLVPLDVDKQTTIAMNRDTLYSFTMADTKKPVTVTIPENDGRYFTLQITDEHHYIYEVFTKPGAYTFSEKDVGSRYASLTFRVFMDPNDAEDVAAANAL